MDSSLSWPAGRQASQPGRVAAIRLEGELSESDAEGEISGEVVRWVTPGDMAGGDRAGGWEAIEGQAGKRNRFGMVVKFISLRWLSTKLIKCPTVKMETLYYWRCCPPDVF